MQHVERQVTKLVELDLDSFTTMVLSNVERNLPDLWRLLMHPRLIERTREVLKDRFAALESELALRRSKFQEIQSECLTRGREGSADFFVARTEYERWRHPKVSERLALQRVRQMVDAERRRQLAASPTPPPRKGTPPNPPNPAKSRANMDALFRLAYAVDKHRAACENAGITPELHDLELWERLREIHVTVTDGTLPLEDWVEDITSKEGFTPRPDM